MSTLSSLESLADVAIENLVCKFMNTSWKQDLAELCLNGHGTLEIDMEPYHHIVQYQKNTHNILTGEVFMDGEMSLGITVWPLLIEAVLNSWSKMTCSHSENYLVLKVF